MKIAPFTLRHTAVDPTPGMPRLFSAGALLMTLCLTACGGGGGGSAAGHDLLADNAQTSQSGNAANNGTGATGTSSGNASNNASNPAGSAGGVSTPQPLNGQPPLGENSASVRPPDACQQSRQHVFTAVAWKQRVECRQRGGFQWCQHEWNPWPVRQHEQRRKRRKRG